MLHRRTAFLALLVAGSLVLAACSGDAEGQEEPAEPAAEEPEATESEATETEPAEASCIPEDVVLEETVSVDLILNFIAGGPNSGFMLAKDLGYYEEVGLEVSIQEGQGSGNTATLIANGNAEFGFADGPAAMQVAAQGGDLVIQAPILQTNGFSVMSLTETGIESIEDLAGKSLAVQPGTAQASLFPAILAANGLTEGDVEIINIDPAALVGSLLEGRVDAITAGADSQGVQLAEQGADFQQILYRDAGVPTVGLSIITQNAYADENPDVVKAFVAASLCGWDDARNDPEAAAAAVAGQFPDAGTEEAFVKQLAVDVELLCAPGAESLGNLPEEHWDTTFDLMTTYLELPVSEPVATYYTTENLPEEPPAC